MIALYVVFLIVLATLVWWGIKYPNKLKANRFKYMVVHLIICLALDHFKPGAFVVFWIIGFIPYFIAIFIKGK